MTFNLRLPADLDLLARAKSQGLGISLNSLICVALGEYLKPPIEAPRVSRRPPMVVRRPPSLPVVPEPPKTTPAPVKTAPKLVEIKLSRAERRFRARSSRKS